VQAKQARLLVADKVHAKAQTPALGPFDRDDIIWEKHRNSGDGGQVREVHKALILWNKLQDFVDGESNSCDFPCKYNQKKRKEVPLGSKEVVREAAYTQKIR
jgi:hypothetical protein